MKTVDLFYSKRLPGKNGGFVDIHDAADKNKLQQYIAAAQVLADKGHQVKLLPPQVKRLCHQVYKEPGSSTKSREMSSPLPYFALLEDPRT